MLFAWFTQDIDYLKQRITGSRPTVEMTWGETEYTQAKGKKTRS